MSAHLRLVYSTVYQVSPVERRPDNVENIGKLNNRNRYLEVAGYNRVERVKRDEPEFLVLLCPELIHIETPPMFKDHHEEFVEVFAEEH